MLHFFWIDACSIATIAVATNNAIGFMSSSPTAAKAYQLAMGVRSLSNGPCRLYRCVEIIPPNLRSPSGRRMQGSLFGIE